MIQNIYMIQYIYMSTLNERRAGGRGNIATTKPLTAINRRAPLSSHRPFHKSISPQFVGTSKAGQNQIERRGVTESIGGERGEGSDRHQTQGPT